MVGPISGGGDEILVPRGMCLNETKKVVMSSTPRSTRRSALPVVRGEHRTDHEGEQKGEHGLAVTWLVEEEKVTRIR